MHAIGAATGISRVDALQSSDAEAKSRPKKDDAREHGAPEVEDRVSLSKELRIRQDRAQGAEEERSEQAQEEDALRSGMGALAASASERERVRELLLRDIETRTADATEGSDRTIKSLPSFEVDIGPYGRAYAVGDGASLEPPARKSTAEAPDDVGTVIGETGLSDVAAEDEAEIQASAEPDSAREAQEAADPAQTTGRGRAPPQPWETQESDRAARASEATAREESPLPPPAERTARAYQSALGLVRAPSGSEGSTIIDELG